jgi:hypothetical protein
MAQNAGEGGHPNRAGSARSRIAGLERFLASGGYIETEGPRVPRGLSEENPVIGRHRNKSPDLPPS